MNGGNNDVMYTTLMNGGNNDIMYTTLMNRNQRHYVQFNKECQTMTLCTMK